MDFDLTKEPSSPFTITTRARADSIFEADVEMREFDILRTYSKKVYKNNKIETSKYNIVTFLPKNLLE